MELILKMLKLLKEASQISSETKRLFLWISLGAQTLFLHISVWLLYL